MDSLLKKKLRALSLALRHTLEGSPSQAGDLESRLNQMGVWRDRPPKPVEELRLSAPDLAARRIVDAFLNYRQEAGISQKEAFAEFVRESAYTWANRLFMLRCLESRGLIDEVVLQKQVYGGRSLVHHRFAQQNPSVCAGEDDGLFSVLEEESRRRAAELPTVFDPQAPAVTLRPSVSALKRCIALLSGTASLNGQGEATDELFEAGDAPGWAYQFWNAEEKDRVFEKVRTEKGAKIEGADLIPATQLYTEPYMVKFLVQNSLGALWAGMYPETKLPDSWEYYVRDVDRTPPAQPDPPPFETTKVPKPSADPWARPNPKLHAEADIVAYARTLTAKVPGTGGGGFIDLRNQLLAAVAKPDLAKLTSLNQEICRAWDREWPARRPKLKKPAAEITFLDPACGSGHFLLEAFDLLYVMYEEEGILATPEEICASILTNNLFGIDIDERAIQISVAALWMHALERAPELNPEAVTVLGDHIIAANLSLPRGRAHLEEFLAKHPEDAELRPALEAVFRGLVDASQLGTLLRIEEPVEQELQRRKEEEDRRAGTVLRQSQTKLDFASEQYVLAVSERRDYEAWKRDVVARLKDHFSQEAMLADPAQAFFGRDARRGLEVFEVLSRRYDTVATNPPYMHCSNLGPLPKQYLFTYYEKASQDLYTAFIARSLELTRDFCYTGIVSQQSFMFLERHMDFRAHLFDNSIPELFAHLGSGAFSEIGGDVVNVVLLVLRAATDLRKMGRFGDFTQVADKAASLRRFDSQHSYSCSWDQFRVIPGSPIAYSLPDEFREHFRGPSLSSYAETPTGMITGDNARYVRYWWEGGSDLTLYMKGGLTIPWWGNVIDASAEGFARMRSSATFRAAGAEFYFREGITYSSISLSLSVRYMPSGCVWDCGGPAIIPRRSEDLYWIMALLNSSFTAATVRVLNPTINIKANDLRRVPVFINESRNVLSTLTKAAIALTRQEESARVETRHHRSSCIGYSSLLAYVEQQQNTQLTIACLLCLIQDAVDCAVLKESGFNAGYSKQLRRPQMSLPYAGGFELLALEAQRLLSDGACSDFLTAIREVIPLSSELDLSQCKDRLNTYLVRRDSVDLQEAEPEKNNGSLSIEDDEAPISARYSALETIASANRIHPVTTWLLLRQSRSGVALGTSNNYASLASDLMSECILRSVGQQWPGENEVLKHIRAEPEGVIPISEGHPKSSLVRKLVESFREIFESSLATQFEEMVGIPLPRWIERDFFPLHVQQFRSRPIAWQIQSQGVGKGATPILTCLVHYHKVTGALPNLRTQYAGALRGSFESEVRTLEQLTKCSAEQSARKETLIFWIDELKQFQETLEGIEANGFATAQLRGYAIVDAIHSLARR